MSLGGRLVVFALMCAFPALLVIALQFAVQTRVIRERGQAEAKTAALRLEERVGSLLASVESVVSTIGTLGPSAGEFSPWCSQALRNAVKFNPKIRNLSLASPKGDVICSALEVPAGVNVADRSYFKSVLASRTSVLSGYTVGRVTRQEVVQFAVPIFGKSNDIVAVALAAFDPSGLTLDLVQENGAVTVLLFDREGVLLSDNNRSSARQRGKSYADTALFSWLRENPGGVAELPGIDARMRLVSARQLVFHDQLAFYIAAETDVQLLSEAVRREALFYVSVVILTIGLIVGIAMVAIRPVVLARTRSLIDVAHAVSAGNYGQRIALSVRDELTPIEEAVNAMIASVEEDKARLSALSERNSLIAEATNDAIFEWNRSTGEFWCNRLPFQEPTDATRQSELTHEHWLASVHPQDYGRVAAEWAEAIASGCEHWQSRYRTGDGNEGGSVTYALERARLLRDASGEVVRVFSGARDVTVETLANTLLMDSEKRYRLLFENSLDGVMQTRLNGGVVHANAAACAMLMRSEADIQQLGRYGLVDLADERLDDLLRERDESGQTRGNLTFLRGDGEMIQVELSSSVYAGPDGEQYTCMIFRDITERLRKDEQIQRLNRELEDRVRQRTAQLELSNRELEAFSYSVSHDLRGPLNTIDGFSKLLGDRIGSAEERPLHYVQRIRAAVRHMGELIEALLALAQVSRVPLSMQAIDLSDLAQGAVQACRELEPNRHVSVQISEGMKTYGDTKLLKVVMTNLIGNACKFTGRAANAQISIGELDDAAAGPVYYVRDNGAGFDMTMAHKLFGTFERLHSVTEFPGSGVGLATVQRILQRHGGSIWAEGRVGEGATFFFVLGAENTLRAG